MLTVAWPAQAVARSIVVSVQALVRLTAVSVQPPLSPLRVSLPSPVPDSARRTTCKVLKVVGAKAWGTSM